MLCQGPEASILGGPGGPGPPNIFLRGVKGEGKARGGERYGKDREGSLGPPNVHDRLTPLAQATGLRMSTS